MNAICRCTLVVGLWFAPAVSTCEIATAQERFESGDLSGFTRSPTEHIINEMYEPIRTRRVEGVVGLGHGGDSIAIPDVLFEVRGPGASPVVRGVKTDKMGRFYLKHIVPGTYRFKATLHGFQSVIGTIVVIRRGSTAPIRIELRVGV